MARKKLKPAGIDPRMKYTLDGFKDSSGIGDKLMTEAAKRGVVLNRKRVGRRVFIDGADAIAYIDALADLPQPICQ